MYIFIGIHFDEQALITESTQKLAPHAHRDSLKLWSRVRLRWTLRRRYSV